MRALSLCAVFASAFISVAFAESGAEASPGRHWHDHGHGRGFELKHVLAKLSLSVEQTARIKAIVAQAKPQMQALYSAQRANEQALGAASPSDPAYPALLANEKSNAVAQIQMASDIKAQIYVVLTPAQQAQIPALVAAQRAARESHAAAGQDP